MRTTLFMITCMAATSASLRADEASLKTSIASASKTLADQPSYRWTTAVESSGQFGGGATRGSTEKDGGTVVSTETFGGSLDFVIKDGFVAVKDDDVWQSLGQLSRHSGDAGFRGTLRLRAVSDFKLPTVQAEELLQKSTGYKMDGDTITASLSQDAVSELLSVRGFGRGGGGGRTVTDPQGTVRYVISDGVLSRFTLRLSGTTEFRGESRSLDRTITTTIADIGSTRIEIPEHAGKILAALSAGIAPPDYTAERGFQSLFNGQDLTGWAGRPQHWSVEDGAITGRTTKDNPARGNNFLIAKDGDKSLIVDDFELRLSYRIIANNDRGFANSGIQYRSTERENFVAAGYQADFESGDRHSGILYDEAGGAGRRGIMAMRGEKVVWTVDGQKQVAGQVGDPAQIQAAIKKNDWNDYTVIANGRHLLHYINGVQTVDVYDNCESKRLNSGILALQLHAGEPMTVQFKDIRIKSLSSPAYTAASNVKVADDFRLERLYTVPKETEGSWVAMCVDPRGRLIVSDQYGKLYRIVPPPVGSAAPIQPEPIDLEIGRAHGLLYAFDSLYVMVNEDAQRRGLFRVRDTDGDDRFDKVELLRKIEGGGEHGLHAVLLSPDKQSLYVVCGDATRMTEFDSSRVPLNWSEDHLLRRLTGRFMTNVLGPGGWIARTDLDGEHWELVAVGFRNEYDAAFNREGELFAYDADMEWDLNTPWYRPTRLNHVISGAEFGWRNSAGKWPAHYIDSFGAVLDIGPGSPTGVTFGYGAKFPAKYQEAFFVCDWSFGKLYAVHLTPQGASYTGELEDFVTGQPLPLTDVVINEVDGAMYFTLGGRRTQSALYRVTYVGDEPTGPSQSDPQFREQRLLRRKLESFHGRQDDTAADTVWSYLGDQDRAIRYAARVALEWQDPRSWRDRALAEQDPRRSIAAILALARVSNRDEFHRQPTDPRPDPQLKTRALSSLDRIDWSQLSPSDRVDLMRAYSLVFTRLGRPDDATRERLLAKFDPLFPSNSRVLNAELAQMLVYLKAPSAATKLMVALREAPTQEEQIDYARTLRMLDTGWTMPLREEYFRWFLTAANFRGGASLETFMRNMKNDAIATLGDDEKASLGPILAARPQRTSPLELLAARSVVKEWTVDDLVPVVESGLSQPRDFERGRKLFGEVACAACHRFGSDGAAVGPDLTTVAARFGVRDVLESIVEPSKAISDQYGAIVIVKKNGTIVTGRVANLSGDSFSVVEDMLSPGDSTGVRRQDIESIEPSKVSVMPTGLLNTLEEDEVQDLFAYLLSRGVSQADVFHTPN